MTYSELVARATAQGYVVRERELYNPGGTEYRTALYSPDKLFIGLVDKWAKVRSLGVDTDILIPDPDAIAWSVLK